MHTYPHRHEALMNDAWHTCLQSRQEQASQADLPAGRDALKQPRYQDISALSRYIKGSP